MARLFGKETFLSQEAIRALLLLGSTFFSLLAVYIFGAPEHFIFHTFNAGAISERLNPNVALYQLRLTAVTSLFIGGMLCQLRGTADQCRLLGLASLAACYFLTADFALTGERALFQQHVATSGSLVSLVIGILFVSH